MAGITRRDLLKYAAYGSVFASGGILTTRVAAGEKTFAGFADAGEEKPLAICISDFHIGERYGGITDDPGHPDRYKQLDDSDSSNPFVRKEFMDFLLHCKTVKDKHGKTKYLIILGDMWDLAMNNQESSFSLSSVFFRQLKELKKGLGIGDLFENVIYVPGNHDHHFWKMLQERYWVTQRLEQGRTPLEMPRVAGLTLDATSTGAIQQAETPTGKNRIPLHNLASPLLGVDRDTPVYVAYPHIFLKKPNNEYTLLTHGHLFEPNWNMVTMMFGDLMEKNDIPLTIRNIEMFNAIATEMHSHALGQTPPYKFWEKIYDLQYTDKFPPEWQKGVKKILETHFYLKGDIVSHSQTQSAKYHDIQALQNQRGLVNHYLAQAEKEGLDSGELVTSLIYGHTHVPSFGETFVRYQDQKKIPVDIHNTGGWVNINPDTFHMPQAHFN